MGVASWVDCLLGILACHYGPRVFDGGLPQLLKQHLGLGPAVVPTFANWKGYKELVAPGSCAAKGCSE